MKEMKLEDLKLKTPTELLSFAEETGVELDRLQTAAPPATAGAKSDDGRIEFQLNPS